MIPTGGPNIVLAASFRSGSTHLADSLCQATGFRPGALNGLHGEGQEEQNISHFVASILMNYGYFVFQQHVKATANNVYLIKAFNNKVVVLTRNLYDSLVSLREWVHDKQSGFLIPGVVLPKDFREWDERRQFEWMVPNVVPWYFQFVYSWLAIEPVPLWLDYDQYYADQASGLTSLLSALGLPRLPSANIHAIVQDKKFLRKGKTGRGRKFPDDLRPLVEAQLQTWGQWAPLIRKKIL